MGNEHEGPQPGTGDRPAGIDDAARLGAELAARGEGEPGPGDGGHEALYAEVIGPRNTDYYLTRFRRFDGREGGYVFTWNWVCVLFPLLWLLYRKMYAWATALLLADLLVMPATSASPGLSLLISLVVLLGVPSVANWLYYGHVRKIVARSRDMAGTDAERRDWRRAVGGVSWIGPAIILGITFVVTLWAVSGAGPPG
jgi:hypothetical protein